MGTLANLGIWLPALGASLTWALSAPIVSRGVSLLPTDRRPEALVQGLTLAVLVGAALLTPFALDQGIPTSLNVNVALAGILTFPVATLLYYLTAHAYGSRADLAVQFARVKPVFSIGLAVLFLGERLTSGDTFSALLAISGVAVMAYGAVRGEFSWPSLFFGLATAGAWALGEMYVGLGFPQGGSAAQTWVTLVVALVVLVPLAVWATWRRPLALVRDWTWARYFALHGAVSFAFAYALFFSSIVSLGLARTVLVTAFWPVISLLVAMAVGRRRGQEVAVPATVWIAAALLLSGSVAQPLFGWLAG